MKIYVLLLTTLIITTLGSNAKSASESAINKNYRAANTGSGDVSQATHPIQQIAAGEEPKNNNTTAVNEPPAQSTDKNTVINGFSNTTILMIENQTDAKALYTRLKEGSAANSKEKNSSKSSKARDPVMSTQVLKSVELLQASTDNEKFLTLPRWQIKCTEINNVYSCEIFIKTK